MTGMIGVKKLPNGTMDTAEELLRVAREAYRAGQLERARDQLHQVLELQPRRAEVFHLLGGIELQTGDLSLAVDHFQRAAALEPGNAVYWNNLGCSLLSAGKFADAHRAFRQALDLRPDYAEACLNLGMTCQQLGQVAPALELYEQATRLNPSSAAAPLLRAKLLANQAGAEAAAGAVASYREVLRLIPSNAEVHADLAALLLEEGRWDEAAHHYREALRLDPANSSALSQVAIYGMFPLSEIELERLRVLADEPRRPRADAARLHFALGAVEDRAAAYDRAFAHFQKANAIRHALSRDDNQAFDARTHRVWIDQMIASCDRTYFERIRHFGRNTERPVFIVGMLRSGTSLVEQILATHPQVHGAGELFEITRLAIGLPARLGSEEERPGQEGYPACLKRLDAPTALALADEYVQHLNRLGGAAARVTDKMPTNFEHLGLIAALFPRARIIHCRREPLDVCLSCYFQHFGSMYFTCDLEDLAAFYLDYERLMAHWRAVLPLPLLEVAYEDLVSDPETVSRRILAFCGLPWDERCLAFHQTLRRVRTMSMAQVRQPIYQRSVGRWRHYAAHLQPLLKALGRPVE
jgi:tetratricopeptide (TPR) repeat protein